MGGVPGVIEARRSPVSFGVSCASHPSPILQPHLLLFPVPLLKNSSGKQKGKR